MKPVTKPKRDFDWPKIRALWEAGHSAYEIERMPKMPTRNPIYSRAAAEGWLRNTEAQVSEKVSEKVSGITDSTTIAEREKLIDSEAEKRAAIEKRHRDEPNNVRALLYNKMKAMSTQTDPDVKEIKAVSDCMLAIQTMERKAHRLDSADKVKLQVEMSGSIDIGKVSDTELIARIAQRQIQIDEIMKQQDG